MGHSRSEQCVIGKHRVCPMPDTCVCRCHRARQLGESQLGSADESVKP